MSVPAKKRESRTLVMVLRERAIRAETRASAAEARVATLEEQISKNINALRQTVHQESQHAEEIDVLQRKATTLREDKAALLRRIDALIETIRRMAHDTSHA